MKNGICLLVIGALLSLDVFAQENASKFYVGSGYGVLSLPDDKGAKFSNANNGSIQFGYKITENFSIEAQYSTSIKSSSGTTFESLDISEAWWQAARPLNPGIPLSDIQQQFPVIYVSVYMNEDIKIQTTALYGVYRSSGDCYVKAKAGYLATKTKVSPKIRFAYTAIEVALGNPIYQPTKSSEDYIDELGANNVVAISDSDFSAGLGVGYKFNQSLFSELEYTRVNDDLTFYSLSINYAF